MRQSLLILVFATVTLLATADDPKQPIVYGAESEKQLVELIQTAVDKKDKQIFLRASCWERLNEKLRKQFELSTPTFMTKAVTKIELVEGGEDPWQGFNGFEYNIEYKGHIAMHYKGLKDPIKMPYGFYKKRFYLATLMKAGTFKE